MKTILVVDDDPNVALFFKEFFRHHGCKALLTHDPERAVKLASESRPDLLIIDILRVPKTGGFALLARIREILPSVKTMVLRRYGTEGQAPLQAVPVDALLRKPVRFEELEESILQLLELPPEGPARPVPSGRSPSIEILLVEDETEVAFFLGELLNRSGFRTEVAGSGEEGLQKAKSRRYDLILADVSMGTMSGVEMIRRIREECAEQPGTIAVLSANVTSEVREKLSGLEVNAILTKPVHQEEVIRWIESQVPQLLAKRR